MDMSNNSKILIRGLGLWALLTLSGCATRQILSLIHISEPTRPY